MGALSAKRNTKNIGTESRPRHRTYLVAASATIYQGAGVVLEGGYATPADAETGLLTVGCAYHTADNSGGADGAISVEVMEGIFKYDNSANADAIAQANVGELCYWVYDNQVALTDGSSSRSIAGTIQQVDSDGVWVLLGLAPAVDGTSLATETAARQDFETDIASTAHNEGAALVGVEDAAGTITATTVEGALEEISLITANLSSNSNGEGASLIGIEDAAGVITATTVEGALEEIAPLTVHKRTVTLTHGAITASPDTNGTAFTANVGAVLPSNARVLGHTLRTMTQFTGGGATTCTLSVGTASLPTTIVNAEDVLGGGTANRAGTAGADPQGLYSAAQLIATLTPDVNHKTSGLTAGAATVDIYFTILA